jgi:hypothetical protein
MKSRTDVFMALLLTLAYLGYIAECNRIFPLTGVVTLPTAIAAKGLR